MVLSDHQPKVTFHTWNTAVSNGSNSTCGLLLFRCGWVWYQKWRLWTDVYQCDWQLLLQLWDRISAGF